MKEGPNATAYVVPRTDDLQALINVDACFDKLNQAVLSHDSSAIQLASDQLISLYGNGSDEVRFKIIAGSGQWVPPDQRRMLLEQTLRHDRSGLVRHEAAFALSNFCDDATEELLCVVGLIDSNSLVRHEAAIALMNVGTERALAYLEKALVDTDINVVLSCRLAISSIVYRASRRTNVHAAVDLPNRLLKPT